MTEHDFAAWERETALDRDTALDDPVADDHEVADELRVLLQLAAPHLPAPADRMDRVLARAALARRRRRRTALAAGLAVGLTAAVLAAAPALAPGPASTGLGPAASGPTLGAIPPAGSPAAAVPETSAAAPSEPSSTAPTASPSSNASAAVGDPTGDGSFPVRATRFTVLDGVIVDVPDSWFDLTLAPAAGQSDGAGYVSSQALTREPGCQIREGKQDPVCLAAGGLLDDSVLVSVRVVRGEKAVSEAVGRSVLVRETGVDKECATQGGSRQLTAQQVIVPNGQPEVIDLSVCLRHPTQDTLAAVDRFATSVRLFGPATNSAITSTG
ncbi:hypothetical protein ACIQ9P_09875 [Kitasatospora sp. NPDC094019]|uniref:hypothetical protein n=1 Tax=Kitasatospora sp. NPDC094019 TaxID=3364091 RepID=UPI0037FD3F03